MVVENNIKKENETSQNMMQPRWILGGNDIAACKVEHATNKMGSSSDDWT
jgi:hypothetical protein